MIKSKPSRLGNRFFYIMSCLVLAGLVLNSACDDLDLDKLKDKIPQFQEKDKAKPKRKPKREPRQGAKYKSLDQETRRPEKEKADLAELSPLEKVPISNINVAGVVMSKDGCYATVYIGKNKRQSYMLREGDKIGDKDGVITRIGKDDRGRGEVVVEETITDRKTGKKFTRNIVLNVP